jgi:pseudomonalisin
MALGCATPASSPMRSLAQGAVHASTQPAAELRSSSQQDETQSVTLSGNVHPQARAEFDMGQADEETRMDRMLLLLKPPPAKQAELDALVVAQQNPSSPLYHQWLTPAEYGAKFGASAQDRAHVTAWLAAQGFTVDEVAAGNNLVVFSGTAAQVSDAFHTAMHRYRVNGAAHLANAQDPQIPETLSGVIGGIVSLNDFRHESEIKARTPLAPQASSGAQPLYSAGSTHYLFPADFAAIYHLGPLYTAGTVGSGSAIAIAGRSNINLSDVASFRALSGLAAHTPSVILAGNNPGLVEGDQDESTLDVEWAGAVAPAAAVSLVTAASTSSTDGIDLAAQYIVNHATAPVVSVSYGSCEQDMGAAELAFYNSLWEQAASQGMSVLVASGDSGAAGCSGASVATGTQHGVNGLCSSPYSTCVGGTEFNEGANPAQYWSATNSANYGSALGYIPEEVWNESAANGGAGLWASGGGASTVYAQPEWQAEVTGASAANGMRAVPDVALSASGHDGYLMVENGGDWIISGTSAAAPSFAGMMALVVETMGGAGQGNANPRLYALVNAQDDPFHTTLSGNNSVPGVAGFWANGAAYNLATGLGSVDGAALAGSWASSAPPSLTLTAGANSVAVTPGGSTALNFTAVTGGSFAGAISFSVEGLPSGLAATWSANPMTPGATASTNAGTLTLAASSTAAQGYFSFTIVATGDGLQATQSVTANVRQQRVCFGLMRPLRLPCGAPQPGRLQLAQPAQ